MPARDLTDVVPLPEPLRDREGNLDPFDWFQGMREEGAIHWDGDRGFWDAFTHDAVTRLVTEPDRFSNAILDETDVFRDTLLGMDPPEHTRKRAVVEGYFTPPAVASYEDEIRGAARRLVRDAVDDDRAFDVVSAIAHPLPLATIGELLDAESAIRAGLGDGDGATQPTGDADGTAASAAFIASRDSTTFDVADVVERIVEGATRNPGDDMVSKLVTSEEGLSSKELVRFCGNLFVAGHVTTTNLIANAVRCLAERPDALAHVREAARAGDEEALDRCVEEVLRFRSPLQHTARVATTDVDVAGREIGEGEPVVAWLLAANRDPAVFDDPATFDPTREPNPHVAFSRGPHVCLGAHLARLEARVALEELFRHVETVDLVDTAYEPVPTSFLHGVRRLPVRVELA